MKMFELLPKPLGAIFRKLTHFICNSRVERRICHRSYDPIGQSDIRQFSDDCLCVTHQVTLLNAIHAVYFVLRGRNLLGALTSFKLLHH